VRGRSTRKWKTVDNDWARCTISAHFTVPFDHNKVLSPLLCPLYFSVAVFFFLLTAPVT
jgi:hypothetical protein